MKHQGNFLRSIVDYLSPVADDTVFVLPNKRSAMFLKKYIRESVAKVAFMPRIMTMRSLLSSFSPYPEAEHRELLFILFDAYRRAMDGRGRSDSAREFDSFVFWGDMMLADFDDIDRSMVNADDLFRNIRSLKEIQADYLDDDQKEVIRRVWGESRLTAAVDEFWLHISDEAAPESMTAKFVYLWEILADIYHNYHAALTGRKLASAGAQYRMAVKAVCDMAAGSSGPHYMFIGFNDLSTAETLIFDKLKSLGRASFFWDSGFSAIGKESGLGKARPMHRLGELMKHFPMPEGFTPPEPLSVPEIEVTAVPSNVGQAKAVNAILSKWITEGAIDTSDPLNTAIIIPDQGLLIPTLFSIPEEIEAVNISMALPFRSTTFATLLHSIISMQLRARKIRGAYHFFFEDVNAIISHPHIQIIAREEADKVSRLIDKEKLYNVDAARIVEEAPGLAPLFRPVHNLDNVAMVSDFLIAIFDWLEEGLSAANGENAAGSSFEIKTISFFRTEVQELARLIASHGVSMTDRTLFHLFERIFNTHGITVNGTPLKGLQVLGVLETRALDFENVIVLSMNEKIFPRKQYTKTMIPNNLRLGFGLPDFESLEWTYAYCFYRLMARAKRVHLLFDSRGDGLGGGEVSRYISQMRYLMPEVSLKMSTVSFGATPDENRVLTVEKTPRVLEALDAFRAGGSLRLSASALKTYKRCPLQFYLSYARRMRGSDDLVDFMTASDYGRVIHSVVQELYSPYRNARITAEIIDNYLRPDNDAVERASRKELLKVRNPYKEITGDEELSAEGNIALDIVAKIARANLAAERAAYCNPDFVFIENEMEVDRPAWKIDDDLSINFYMSIDRVDSMDDYSYRFVDFKTGSDEAKAPDVAALFDRNEHKYDGIFQLLTYCEAFAAMRDGGSDIQPVLHLMRKISREEGIEPIIIGKEIITSYRQVSAEFLPLLKGLIKEIFDPAVPFTQCEKPEQCTYCPFLSLCGRTVPQHF